MRKRMFALALCAALLAAPGGAAAEAGGQDDPLISQSYIETTFLPQAKAALKTAAKKTLAARRGGESSGFRIAALAPGAGLRLTAGQQLTLASGTAKLYTASGEAVLVSAGAAAADGTLGPGARVIACEDAEIYVDALTDAALKVSAGAAAVDDGCPFSDVSRGAWYHGDVAGACRRALVNGLTPTSYAPDGELTVAQCVKLAACMHQLWNDGAVTLANSPAGAWYDSYVDYALENGILAAAREDYDAPITRLDFVGIFWGALPEEHYAGINFIPDGAIPDLSRDAAGAAAVYRFYRAGILTGYTGTSGYAEHAFGPDSTITRAEVATIMNRMFDEDARASFSI